MIDPFFLLQFLSPIPFMLLYYYKSSQLNHIPIAPVMLGVSSICYVVSSICAIDFNIFGIKFRPQLVFLYLVLISLGTMFFQGKHKMGFPQALSISFNLAFFNSVYWEIPIHIYTPLYVGFLDAMAPVHFIYAFPLFFILQKFHFPKPHRKVYALLFLGIVISTICLIPIMLWYPYLWEGMPPFWLERLWDTQRIISFLMLLNIFKHAHSTVNEEDKK